MNDKGWKTRLLQVSASLVLILAVLSPKPWMHAQAQLNSPQAPTDTSLVFLPLLFKDFQPAWVIGSVTEQGSGALKDVSVCSQNGECATTDAQGNYLIHLSAGWKQLTAQKDGYTPATTSLQVPAMETRRADFALLPSSSFTSAGFQGTVKDAQTQAALIGATVCTHLNQCATTDQNGTYTLNVNRLGQFELRAEKESYQPLTKSASAVNGQVVTVDFALPQQWQGAWIEGTVIDASRSVEQEKALAGVRLCTQFNECATSDSAGYYKITLNNANSREVIAQKDGFYTIAKEIQPQAGQTVTLNFALSPYLSGVDARIVLTWDATPKFYVNSQEIENDLDAYLYIEHSIGNRVIYFDADGQYLSSLLIYDVREGSGPETIDILSFEPSSEPNQTHYRYGVNHVYSGEQLPTLFELGAQVCLYVSGETAARCYLAPPGDRRFWSVFELVQQQGDQFVFSLHNCLKDEIPEITEDANGSPVVGVSFPSCP